MNDSIYSISLDVQDSAQQALLPVKRNDTGREIHITLTESGAVYVIASGSTAILRAVKPDGTILYNACTIEDNLIKTQITGQMVAVTGIVTCEMQLIGINGLQITSPKFALQVANTIYDDDIVESTDEFTALTEAITAVANLDVDASKVGKVTTVTITHADGSTTEVEINDGEDGADGATGATGPQGPQGPTGAKGNKGDKGDKGDTGDTGPQGPKGDKGDKGDTGAQGPQGFQGVQGPRGIPGATGAKGDKGDKGDTGSQGPIGPIGHTPDISIGTVTTLDPDESATVTITGTDEEPVLNFGIPKGDKGDTTTVSGTWGYISGDLDDQTDLVNALDAKVDKPTGATAGNVTVIGSNNNIEDSGISKDNLLIAPQLASNNIKTDSIPYKYRQTGGGIGVGNREYDSIVGGSVVWNQKLSNYNFASASGWGARYGSVSVADGVATVTTTSAGTARGLLADGSNRFAYNANDKLWLAVDIFLPVASTVSMSLSGAAGKNAGTLPANQWVRQEIIWTSDTTQAACGFAAYVSASLAQGATIKYREAFACNLTELLGPAVADRLYAMETDEVGSGIALLKRMFPNDTYPYTATPSLESVSGLQSHKTVGFNLFDKSNYTVYNGYINFSGDGTNGVMTYNLSHRTVWIPCLPNTSYSITRIRTVSNERFGVGWSTEVPNTSNVPVYNCYQATRSGTAGNTMTIGTVTGANAKYLVIWLCWTDSNIPQAVDTLCVNVSDPARNGTYEPYEEHTYPLDDSLTLRGVAVIDDNNNIAWDGDIYAPDGIVTRRYVEVDLGVLTWSYTTYSGVSRFYTTLGDAKKPSSSSEVAHAICSKYLTIPQSNAWVDGILCITTGGQLNILDSTYSSAAAFKAAMNGVKMVYELDTPTTETAEPYESLQICDPLGTEEYVTTGICPVGHETRYPEDSVKKLSGLPSNFSTLIAPTEVTYKATRAYTTGRLLIVHNVLYKATTSIASGATLTVGTNITATTLDEVIASL